MWLAISSSDSIGYKMLQNVKCMEMSGIELQGKLQYVNILHVCFQLIFFFKLLLLEVTQTNFQLTWFSCSIL